MKIQRQKKIRRRLEFYKINFDFIAPFTLIVDGTFCFAALQHKVNISEQIPKLFEDNLKILTTPCIVTETEQIGSAAYGAFLIVKQFSYVQCGHSPPRNGAKCIASLVKGGNQKKYAVASQDQALRSQLRAKLAVPILYLHNSAPTLEKPAPLTAQAADRRETERTGLSRDERDHIKNMKRQILGEPEPKPKKKRKKQKGANPLSCKKRQRGSVASAEEAQVGDGGAADGRGRKRRRPRLRLAKHVRDELNRRKQAPAQANTVGGIAGRA